jgi:hypothetical protein
VLLVTAVLASLTLSSCLVLPFWPTGDDGGSSSSSSSAPVTPQSPPPGTTGLDGFYAQRLAWST